MNERINNILNGLKSGRVSVARAAVVLAGLPYKDLGFAKVDCHRTLRRGFPEVIFGKGKTAEQILKIAKEIISHDGILLITHADEEIFLKLRKLYPKIKYGKSSKAIYFREKPVAMKKGTVLII